MMNVEDRWETTLALEQVAFLALVGGAAGAVAAAVGLGGGAWAVAAGTLLAVGLAHLLLARRWGVEWPVYGAQAAVVGAYLCGRAAAAGALWAVPGAVGALLLLLLCFLDLGVS